MLWTWSSSCIQNLTSSVTVPIQIITVLFCLDCKNSHFLVDERQEDQEFKASLGYTACVRPYLKQPLPYSQSHLTALCLCSGSPSVSSQHGSHNSVQDCYSITFSRGPCVKGLIPNTWCYWEQKPLAGTEATGGRVFECGAEFLAFPFFLFALLLL